MFSFLRNALQLSPAQVRPAFQNLLERISKYEGNRFETRAFVYLDVVSWLESKIENKPVQDIIHNKYKRQKKTIA